MAVAASGLRRLHAGHAPNCSAAGSLVGVALVSAVAGAALLNAWAGRLASAGSSVRLRPGPDGGGTAHHPDGAVADVDEDAAQALRRAGAREVGAVGAPDEAHVAVTGRCPVACDDCYLEAGPAGPAGGSVAELRQVFRELADRGVFEVALGGGEVATRRDIVAVCSAAREVGLVPNLTTSGFGVTPALAQELRGVVGQVNVSIDGLGAAYVELRGWDGADRGLRAVQVLADAGLRVGVNTVLARPTLPGLEALGAAIRQRGAEDWQWLRLKPVGRALERYPAWRLLPEESGGLWARALEAERLLGLAVRWDCALVPWLVAAGLDAATLEKLGVRGCPGGDRLVARSVDGAWSACSFVPGGAKGAFAEAWADDPTLQAWRHRAAAPPEPCRSCSGRLVCRGGCRAVSAAVLGASLAPDPECPRVLGLA